MKNLEKSEVIISKILTFLIDNGIQESNLEFGDLNLEDSYAPFFVTACYWLLDEGLVRCRDFSVRKNSARLLNPVLTSRGLAALGQSISVDGSQVSLGEAVREVSTNEATYAKVGSLVGSLLGSFTKSVS